MTENIENTFSAYLGPQFQLRLMWQLLVEPEFAEKIIPDLAIEYFDDPNLRRLFLIILEYYKEFGKVPNLQNQSIHQAIYKYKTPNNLIEEETLFGVIKRISLWNERVINKQMLYDGDVVQLEAYTFIKQQEYRKTAEDIQTKVKNGEIKNKNVIANIEERFQKISHIGEENDESESLTEGISKALRKEFRETIPTGIGVIDSLTGGGLGKGEIGVILAPSGVGKTTALTVIANTAYEQEKNVAQIIFEDTKDQVKRKHYTIWAKSALSRLNEDEENERVTKIVNRKAKELEGKGRLIIKKFSQEDTTMKDIRNWMLSYEKKWGFKFDIMVLDYLDCVESHKKGQDRNENELTVIKGFEALASDFDIPCWTAIQSNRSGFGAEFVEAYQSGGSIKRVQKAHFFMSIAKTPAQQEANFANVRIIKARFAKDGQTFEDCVFNNDTMEIRIDDSRYPYTRTYKNLKHHDESDVENLENKANKFSTTTKIHAVLSQHEENNILDKLNSDDINTLLRNNNSSEELDPNFDFQSENESNNNDIINLHISTSRTDLNDNEVNQIIEIAKEAINESVNEETEIIDEIDDELNKNQGYDYGIDVEKKLKKHLEDSISSFEWTGETINAHVIEHEVKLDDVNIDKDFVVEDDIIKNEDINKIDLNQFKSARVTIQEPPPNMNNDLLIDPDEPQGNNKSVYEMLVKKREHQHVIKKE